MINKFECDVARHKKVIEIKPAGRLDSAHVPIFERILMSRINKGDRHIVVNFDRVMFISSSGLRILLLAGKNLKSKDGTFSLCSLKPQIRDLLRTAAFERLLSIRDNRDEAIEEAKVAAGCAGADEPEETAEPAGERKLGQERKARVEFGASIDGNEAGWSLRELIWTLVRPWAWFRKPSKMDEKDEDEDDDEAPDAEAAGEKTA